MALVTALDRAKQYLILPVLVGEQETRTDNALIPATALFEQRYRRYIQLQYMDFNFDSSGVEKIDDDFVRVQLTKKLVRNMRAGFALRVETGNYTGVYSVVSVNHTDYTIVIEAEYYNEVITFSNDELQLYTDALAWYVCGFVTLTQQEIKERKIMITSTQSGECSSTQYDQSTIRNFRNDRFKDGDRLLISRHYQSIT